MTQYSLHIDSMQNILHVKKDGKILRKEIAKIIKEWKDEAGVTNTILVGVYPSFRETITICTDSPGLMIGYHGELVNKYQEKLKEINHNLKEIKFVETESYYIK